MALESILATRDDLETIKKIVYTTMLDVYPKYYPKEVVEYYINHHKNENIIKDIDENKVWLFCHNAKPVGTGTVENGHINRVFVFPNEQNKGYGREIMDFLEKEASKTSKEVLIDSSLPSFNMYTTRGYAICDSKKIVVKNDCVLFYMQMKKCF